jgi:membrane associated rhomboid family serine protease
MFLLFPTGVDYRTERYPVVTFTLIGICTAIYLGFLPFELSSGERVELWELEHLWLTPSLSHWWTYITSMFVHADIWHLLGNMVYLFLFGACVEDQIGRLRFTLFYLAAGLFSAFAHIALSPAHFNSTLPLGGASGAISACIGGFALYLWKSKIEFGYFWFFFFRFGSGQFFLPAWLVISFWFGSDLLGALADASRTTDGGGTAFAAHVGGTLFGVGWIALERVARRRREARDEAAEAAAHQAEQAGQMPPTILIYMNQEQTGPYNRAQIGAMLRLGAIPPDALFWCDGMADWQPIRDLGLGG